MIILGSNDAHFLTRTSTYISGHHKKSAVELLAASKSQFYSFQNKSNVKAKDEVKEDVSSRLKTCDGSPLDCDVTNETEETCVSARADVVDVQTSSTDVAVKQDLLVTDCQSSRWGV